MEMSSSGLVDIASFESCGILSLRTTRVCYIYVYVSFCSTCVL